MQTPIGYIYITSCKTSDMLYIGKHKGSCFDPGYIGTGTRFLDYVKQNGGASNFVCEPIYWCYTDQELIQAEELALEAVDAMNNPMFLNLTNRSAGVYKHADETKQKISESVKQIWLSDEYRQIASVKRKAVWAAANPIRRTNQSKTMSTVMHKLWSDPTSRSMMLANIKRGPVKPLYSQQQKRLLRQSRLKSLLFFKPLHLPAFIGSLRDAQDFYGIRRHKLAILIKTTWNAKYISDDVLIEFFTRSSDIQELLIELNSKTQSSE
jgi:hypothetical protein